MKTIAQIRAELQKRSQTLLFTDSDRALLAVLEMRPYRDCPGWQINADYSRGHKHSEEFTRKAICEAWG